MGAGSASTGGGGGGVGPAGLITNKKTGKTRYGEAKDAKKVSKRNEFRTFVKEGGVIGAVVTTAIIVATSSPQFLGAMVMGPLAAWIMKQVDDRVQDSVPEGFEMLYDNFSLGILGWGLAVVAYNVISPVLEAITNALGCLLYTSPSPRD